MPGPRRRGRILALQTLYEVDSVGHNPNDILERPTTEESIDKGTWEFAQELVRGVVKYRGQIDQIIQTHASSWPVSQISIIDRNILRLAIFELMFYSQTPPKVVINEAVELAKVFGSDSSPRFVNGVLGAVMAKASS